MHKARKCKAEKTVATSAQIMLHVPKLARLANLVVTDRLVDRDTWRDIAKNNEVTLGAAKRIFRLGVDEIETLLRFEGRLKNRRRPAAQLKLKP